MKKLHKNMLIFSVVYWLLVVMGLILTGFAFSKVPIGFYGLKVHYFSSGVDTQYYTNGLYHAGVGYYFVLYPQPRSYLMEREIAVINKDLEKITLTYTLSYRINPSGILNLYYSVADQYEDHLIAIVNNIISSVFSTLTQAQSRVTAQQTIIGEFNKNGKSRVDQVFGKGIMVEAIWIDKLKFDSSEPYYDSAYVYSSSTSPSYEEAAYNLTVARLEVNGVSSAIRTSKEGFVKRLEVEEQKSYDSLTNGAYSGQQEKMISISQQFNASRVLNYYPPSSLDFY